MDTRRGGFVSAARTFFRPHRAGCGCMLKRNGQIEMELVGINIERRIQKDLA